MTSDMFTVVCVLLILLTSARTAHRRHERDAARRRHPAGGSVDSHWRSNAQLFGWDR